jgi:hypothetical protein
MISEPALSAKFTRNFTLTMRTHVWPYGKYWVRIHEKHTYKLMHRYSLFDLWWNVVSLEGGCVLGFRLSRRLLKVDANASSLWDIFVLVLIMLCCPWRWTCSAAFVSLFKVRLIMPLTMTISGLSTSFIASLDWVCGGEWIIFYGDKKCILLMK